MAGARRSAESSPHSIDILSEAVASGRLSASHDYGEARDADVILICVQTDRDGNAPAYGPLFEALTALAGVLQTKSKGNVPVVIFESTLAPTSMTTVVREHFARFGLVEGRDVPPGQQPQPRHARSVAGTRRHVRQAGCRSRPGNPGSDRATVLARRDQGNRPSDQQHDRGSGQDAGKRLPRRADRVRRGGRPTL